MARFEFKPGDRVVYDGRLATIATRSRVKTVGMFTLPDGGPFYTLEDGLTVRQAELRRPDVLPVIFRRPRGKEMFEIDGVTAFFPTLPHDTAGRYNVCYAHVGQHGSCSLDWYWSTRPALESEYADLLAELRGIYGNSMGGSPSPIELQVCHKMTARHRKAFADQVREWRRVDRMAAA